MMTSMQRCSRGAQPTRSFRPNPCAERLRRPCPLKWLSPVWVSSVSAPCAAVAFILIHSSGPPSPPPK